MQDATGARSQSCFVNAAGIKRGVGDFTGNHR